MNPPSDRPDTSTGLFRRLQVDVLSLEETVRTDIWSASGQLLLAKGQVISTPGQLRLLAERDAQVSTAHTHESEAGALHVSAMPAGLNPLSAWPLLHGRLSRLLHLTVQSGDFVARTERLHSTALELLASHREKSLFMLVQMVYDTERGYCASHALLCAAICQIVAEEAGLPVPAQQALFNAALTMNIAMGTLQDELAQQSLPLDASQRTAVDSHAQDSATQLRQLGVTDPLWLDLVSTHHQADRLQTQAAQILPMVDVYVACISPRRTRHGLRPQKATREAFLQSQQQGGSLGAVLVKALGVYPTGTYVRLESGEVAVVTGQGKQANHPLTFAIRGRNGLTFDSPASRDTAEAGYAVRESLVADDVSIRLNAARLFRQT